MTAPYTVHYNAGSSEQFATFAEALPFYREHVSQPHGATLLGDGADYDDGRLCNDGLTEVERDAVEECE